MNVIQVFIYLEKLLEKGKVDAWELSRELQKKDGHVDVAAFESACGVINDYCTTGGNHVRGGTGFLKPDL